MDSRLLRIIIFDLARGLNITSYYRSFMHTPHNDRELVLRIQKEKLSKLLFYVQQNNPYYKDLFEQTDFDAKHFADIKQLESIPPLTREALKNNTQRIISRIKPKGPITKHSSSGTTGFPVTFYHDAIAESAGIAAGYFLMGQSGWYPGAKTMHIWGNPDSIIKWKRLSSKIKRQLFRQKNISASLLNDPRNIEKVLDIINGFKPEFIDGYPNAIYNMSEYILGNNYKVHKPKMVFTTAESLSENARISISEAFAPICDIYGCSEINGIAVSLPDQKKYIICDTHVLVERNKDGEILITDLDNYYMPFIRYKNGDLISPISEPEKSDQYQFSTFTDLHGRTSDFITLPDGRRISPITILGGTLFRKYSEIKRHQIIWDGTNLSIILESSDKSFKKILEKELANILTPFNLKWSIKLINRIESEESGKFSYFKRS